MLSGSSHNVAIIINLFKSCYNIVQQAQTIFLAEGSSKKATLCPKNVTIATAASHVGYAAIGHSI